MRIVQISDLHLSRTHSYFFRNWEVVLEELNADPPDLVVVSGDVSFNGADSRDDLEFASAQLDRIVAPHVVIPGNHDVGDHPLSTKLDQPVNEERLERWRSVFGDVRFSVSRGGRRVIGVADALFGSGLEAEVEEERRLIAELRRSTEPVLLFVHKPLFTRYAEESEFNKSCLDPDHRSRLLPLLTEANVPLVASAHVHVYKRMEWERTELVWCPATSFVITWEGKDVYDGVRRVGYIEYDLSEQGRISHRWVEPALLVNYDLRNWFMQCGSSVKLPPYPIGVSPARR